MAGGDPTMIDHGMHDISGSTLIAAVNAITNYHPLLSGSSLHFVPAGQGQIQLIQVNVEGTG
jgi:hypothetical protein